MDEDVEPVVLRPYLGVLVVFFGRVVAYNEGVLGQLLEETFRCRAIDVEV